MWSRKCGTPPPWPGRGAEHARRGHRLVGYRPAPRWTGNALGGWSGWGPRTRAEHGGHQRRRPTYAPPGRHLIAAAAPTDAHGDPPAESATRRHAADILGADAHDWVLLKRHVIAHALPAQPPPLRVRNTIRAPRGIWVCGDHRDTASIQGALVSGRRTAEALLREPTDYAAR